MYTYKISYQRGERTVTLHRKAESASQAVEKLAWQYGQRYTKVRLVDADTRGQEWAEVSVFSDRGCQDWIYTALAVRI